MAGFAGARPSRARSGCAFSCLRVRSKSTRPDCGSSGPATLLDPVVVVEPCLRPRVGETMRRGRWRPATTDRPSRRQASRHREARVRRHAQRRQRVRAERGLVQGHRSLRRRRSGRALRRRHAARRTRSSPSSPIKSCRSSAPGCVPTASTPVGPRCGRTLEGQQRVTATFRRPDGHTLHVRSATQAEPDQRALYDALGVDSQPGGVRKTIV